MSSQSVLTPAISDNSKLLTRRATDDQDSRVRGKGLGFVKGLSAVLNDMTHVL